MDESVFNHLLYKIANATICTYPYTHIYIEDVFPTDFYEEMIAKFPDTAHFKSLVEMGNVPPGTYENRYVLPLKTNELGQLPFDQLVFWTQFSQAFTQESWPQTILSKFHSDIRGRFGDHYLHTAFYSKLELLSDQSEYAIGPHTDHPRRVLSLLFYLPTSKDQPHLGTSIYRPKDPYFKCEGLEHHTPEEFTKVYTAPFLPNSVFGFIKSDRSFHGVEPIGKQQTPRRLLSYTLFWAPPSSILSS